MLLGNLGGCWTRASLDGDLSFLAEAITGCTPGGCGLYRRQTGDASCVLLLAEPMVHAHIYQNSCQLAGGLRGTLN